MAAPSGADSFGVESQTVVIKVGTSSLLLENGLSAGGAGTIAIARMATVVEVCAALRRAGHRVVLVSSGAVGVGCVRLGIPRPEDMAGKQALASIGQVHLMRYYDDFFSSLDCKCAQVLLTYSNLFDRAQYGNAQRTLTALLDMGVVPIINENDTVATHELKIGDNDTLSAMVAGLVGADWLFMLTDVDALYTANPATDRSATAIRTVNDIQGLRMQLQVAGDVDHSKSARRKRRSPSPSGARHHEPLRRERKGKKEEAGGDRATSPPAASPPAAPALPRGRTPPTAGDSKKKSRRGVRRLKGGAPKPAFVADVEEHGGTVAAAAAAAAAAAGGAGLAPSASRSSSASPSPSPTAPSVSPAPPQLTGAAADSAPRRTGSASGKRGKKKGGEAEGAGAWGTGGMGTKLVAAQLACAAGVTTVVMHSKRVRRILEVLEGEEEGTLFTALERRAPNRKRWILALHAEGDVIVDAGAAEAVLQSKSLFAAGVCSVAGDFEKGDAVRIVTLEGREVAHAIVAFAASDVRAMAGKKSSEVKRLGYEGGAVAERDNIVVTVTETTAGAADVDGWTSTDDV